MRYLYLLLCIMQASALMPSTIFAQNLVNNGNFEQFTQCPDNWDQTSRCIGWRQYHNGTTDYYNRCSDKVATVPANYIGSQEPANGNGYMGSHCWGHATMYREYLAGTMRPMVGGRTYNVSMSVSLADSSGWGINGLGIWFYVTGATTTLDSKDVVLKITPQVMFPDTVADMKGWVRLSATFKADNPHRNLVIGEYLASPAGIKTKPNGGTVYYYIDSVVVEEQTLDINTISIFQDVDIYPNPVSNELTIEGIKTGTEMRLMDMMGRVLINITATATTEHINTSALPAGTYIMQLRYDGELMNHKLLKE